MPRPVQHKQPKELTQEERLNKNYLDLHSQLQSNSLEKALKSCNKILKLAPGDSLILNTKCQILISLDKYKEVLELISTIPIDQLPSSLKLYCQYKNGREEETRQGLLEWEEGQDDRIGKILEAQVLYRLEDYESSRDAFEDLIATVEIDSPELADLQTNLEACNSHLEFLESVPSLLSAISIPSIESLESTPIINLIQTHPLYKSKPFSLTPRPIASTSKLSSTTPTTTKKLPKKLPKHYDPLKVLDPDRWLPKRERPGFADEIVRKREMDRGRKKGKEREKLLVQGGIEEKAPVVTKSGGGGGGNSNKKKGKGKK